MISTQAIGLFLIVGLTVQSYLDLRALRDATIGTETERPSEPSEAQAEVGFSRRSLALISWVLEGGVPLRGSFAVFESCCKL